MRIKPVILDVIEDDGMWLDKSTMTYYDKDALEPIQEIKELDEAAEKVEDYYDVGEEHGYLCCHRGDIKDAFKAGAEWIAEQGVTKEAVIEIGTNKIIITVTQPILDVLGLHSDDKIVVQLRKKQ